MSDNELDLDLDSAEQDADAADVADAADAADDDGEDAVHVEWAGFI